MNRLNKKQVLEIIEKDTLEDVEMLEIIREYICEVKGVDPGEIKRVANMTQALMMNTAYDKALRYYVNKFKTIEDEQRN